MKHETLTPEQTQTLLATIPKIEQAGGPKWYDWCVLGMDSIEGTNAFNEDELLITHSPPAVAAAVIAWALEVWVWDRETTHRAYREAAMGMDYDDRKEREPFQRNIPTQLAASVALISAVAEGLENE